jgi:hypothetical protein
MQSIFQNIILLSLFSLLISSCAQEESNKEIKPTNYTILLDLSDRVLTPGQLEKDFYLIETAFKSFEKHAKRNLILTSNDRFSVKIIPQKNSKLAAGTYEDLLQLYLDELDVKDKHKALQSMANSLQTTLNLLKRDAVYSSKKTDYFGVDIWAYLHDNGIEMSKIGYENTILVLTDGYFDFESQAHVIQNKNQYTSTRFLKELNVSDWKNLAENKNYGLLPIELEKSTRWIVAGIAGKKSDDILQTEKIKYFWKKWLNQSGVTSSEFILNSSKTDMSSAILEHLK